MTASTVDSPEAETGAKETRERIVEEATRLFREKGYDGVSMKELADRVGITAAGLYWHFPSKQEILVTTLEEEMLALIRRTEVASQGKSPEERLRGFVRSHVLFNIERLGLARLYVAASYTFPQLVSSLDEAQRRRLKGIERQHLQALVTILRAVAGADGFFVPDLTPTAFAIIAIAEHVVHWFHADGRISPTELADLYADFALRIVRTPPRHGAHLPRPQEM